MTSVPGTGRCEPRCPVPGLVARGEHMGRARRHHPPSGGLPPIYPARFGAAQAAEGPEREEHHERESGRVGERRPRSGRPEMKPRPASTMRVSGLTVATPWIQPCSSDERHVHRREEEHQEDRHLHHRAGLHRAEPHRDAGRPEHGGEVDEERERVEADEVDAAAADVHARDQRDHRQHGRRDQPAAERGERVAEDDPDAVRRRQQQPPREAALEVARDPEAGEDAAEGRRLQQHEDELEGRVAGREVEARARGGRARGRRRRR